MRGSHGSGKTTISQRLIDEHPHEALVEPAFVEGEVRRGKNLGTPYRKNFKKANAFALEGGAIVVGRKQAGMDGYLPHETIEDTLRYWAPRGHLVFENVLLSANIGRWGELFTELEPINHFVLAHMDTPWETCRARVLQRRADGRAAGKKYRQTDAELKVGAHEAHWKRCRRTAARAATQGFDVRWIDFNFAYELVHDALVRAGWQCPVHGLLRPDLELTPWRPTEAEADQVVKTLRLPWETTSSLGSPTVVEAGGDSSFGGLRQLVASPASNPTPVGVASSGTVFAEDLHAELGDPFDF